MSTKDAYMFPVIGSGVLFGLYLLFKFLNKDYVNLLLTAYFVFLGFLAVEESLRPAVAAFVSTVRRRRHPRPPHAPLIPSLSQRPLTNFALERIPTFLHEKGGSAAAALPREAALTRWPRRPRGRAPGRPAPGGRRCRRGLRHLVRRHQALGGQQRARRRLLRAGHPARVPGQL